MSDAIALQARGLGARALSAFSHFPVRKFGNKIGFLGDSITAGGSATNPLFRFTTLVPFLLGTANVAPAYNAPSTYGGSVVSGHPGFTSADILPFLVTDIIAAGCDTVVILAGTNDSVGTPLAAWASNMLSMMRTARQAGLRIVVGTIPPRGAPAKGGPVPASPIRVYNDSQNFWIRQVVPQYGVVADFHHVLVDPTTGFLRDSYDLDSTHPTNPGYWAMAQEVVRAINDSALTVHRQIDGFSTLNLLTNPYFVNDTSNWILSPSSTGTGTLSRVSSDSTGLLDTGSYLEVLTDTGSTTDIIYRQSVASGASTWQTGDIMAFSGKMQVVDVAGDWMTKHIQFGGTSYGDILMVDGITAASIEQLRVQYVGALSASSTYNFGPNLQIFTAPSTTSLQFWLRAKGANYRFRFAELGLINLTKSGILNLPSVI